MGRILGCHGVRPTARKIVKLTASIYGATIGAGAVEEIAGGACLTVVTVAGAAGLLGLWGGSLIKRRMLGNDPFDSI